MREAREELAVEVVLGAPLLELDFEGRQVYFEARVVSGSLSGEPFDEGTHRGTYLAVRVPLERLAGLDVRPPELAALLG